MTRRFWIAGLFAVPAALLAQQSPERQQQQQQRRGRGNQGGKATGAGGSTPGEILLRFPGTLKSVTKKQILLQVEGEQELIFRRVKKTRFLDGEKEAKEADAPTSKQVVIEGRRELDGELDAINVRWNEKAPEPQ